MALHAVAECGFGRAADMYRRGRPSYPPAAIAWLSHRFGLGPGVTVIDLAAGTGKLTRLLTDTGAEVFAVEPVAAMREAIDVGTRTVDGTAEAIPLPDASADVVTVGQAFHWFDAPPALAEIHRVLRPGGSLALLWNTRCMEDAIHAAIEKLIAPHCVGVPRHRTYRWRAALERSELFGAPVEQRFANRQCLDREGLADRVGSISAIAALPDAERERLLAQARQFVTSGPITLHYDCEVQLLSRIDA